MRAHGVVFVKENCSPRDRVAMVVHNTDSSVTRSRPYFRRLFALAGLRVLLTRRQAGFPDNMLPVYMFALAPADEAVVPARGDDAARASSSGWGGSC